MNVLSISKKEREVTVELSADELVRICNVLYAVEEGKRDKLYHELYSDMMIARDMCQYGHIDNFSLGRIVVCRNGSGKGLDGMLSEADIETFNDYLENNDMRTAFGNSDFRSIYSKIVGRKTSKKIQEWIDNGANE